jgi:hypothetical protein
MAGEGKMIKSALQIPVSSRVITHPTTIMEENRMLYCGSCFNGMAEPIPSSFQSIERA